MGKTAAPKVSPALIEEWKRRGFIQSPDESDRTRATRRSAATSDRSNPRYAPERSKKRSGIATRCAVAQKQSNGNERFSQAYLDFLNSSEWRSKREEVLKRDGYRCRWCGGKPAPGNGLEVDHGSYPSKNLPYDQAIEAFQNQPIDDMMALHKKCHALRTKAVRANRKKR